MLRLCNLGVLNASRFGNLADDFHHSEKQPVERFVDTVDFSACGSIVLDSAPELCLTCLNGMGDSKMAYEWDAKKARKAHVIKVLSSLAAAVVTAGFPAWLVFEAINR